ncbi:sensor histidine kinase [Halorhabdus amylolytica]|uniref:sensor histidine kinase n=1 Tax=Halorhabdus amylolytica TaxID=2559573 RepID=UPI0010A9C560|nr:ATP-binding protein [Halorhabdus amylolytica]
MQLQDVASGLSHQYTNFIDALQEPIDNSVSAIVKNEDYFDELTEKEDDVVEICISIIKEGDLVWFIVADNGPGIPYDTLQRDIFILGDESSSDGILNNVGWGLKQAVAWFENQVNINVDIEDSARDSNFRIITRSEEDGLLSVGGPIDGSLQIYEERDNSLWTDGLQGDSLEAEETGTRVYLPCTLDRVDEDLWKQGPADLSTRLHALQERLGLQYRYLLKTREDNRITIRYEDKDDGTTQVYEVPPLDLEYDTELDPDYPLVDEFEITADGVTYDVTYERGMIDYEEICAAAEEADSGLVTSGNKLRWYTPSQATAGVDVYANGRILMFGELDIFDRSYNPALNYFGGVVRIIPQNNSDEVPTENRKVAIDRGSELWHNLAEKLRELGVEEKRYDDDEEEEREEKPDEGEKGDGEEEGDGSGEEEEGGEEEEEEDSDGGGDEGENGSDEGEGEEDAGDETDEEDESEDDTEGDDNTDGEDGEDGEDEEDREDGEDGEGEDEGSGEETEEDEDESEENGDDTGSDSVVEQLKDANPDHSFEQDQVFDGAEVDLVETQEDDSVILWVIKSETATPADAYTLAMVQNHYKRENSSLSEVRLVAPDASSVFETDLSELQDYNDLQGDPYSIAYKPEDEI